MCIDSVELPNGAGQVRLIAGDYRGHHGPASESEIRQAITDFNNGQQK
jgi:hypothetical protein